MMVFSKISGSICGIGAIWPSWPALATNPSRRPQRVAIACARRAIAAVSVWSSSTIVALPSVFDISSSSSSSAPVVRPVMMTSAPAFAQFSATDRPMPRLAPVIRITLSVKSERTVGMTFLIEFIKQGKRVLLQDNRL